MSKYCKVHPGKKYEYNCLNCQHGKYINEQIKKGQKEYIKPEVLANHKRRFV